MKKNYVSSEFTKFNIYCDESCHLENDHQKAMVLAAIWCQSDKVKEIVNEIRSIKVRFNLPKLFENKWTKVSPAKIDYYNEILNYFFECKDLHFRAVIIPDKSLLRHPEFNQTHDEWYYKMYFDLIKVIIKKKSSYRIFLDIKDTRGRLRIPILKDFLNKRAHFDAIEHIQLIHSHEVELVQLVDILMGTVSSVNRGGPKNVAKKSLIEIMQDRSGLTLTQTTSFQENKVNILRWDAE